MIVLRLKTLRAVHRINLDNITSLYLWRGKPSLQFLPTSGENFSFPLRENLSEDDLASLENALDTMLASAAEARQGTILAYRINLDLTKYEA